MKKIGVLLIAAVFTISCNSNKESVELQMETAKPLDSSFVEVGGKQLDADLYVSLYSKDDSLKSGYNNIYFRISDEKGNIVNNAPFTITPLMVMEQLHHGGPALQPIYNQKTQTYDGGTYFSMPGIWDMQMEINGVEAVANKLSIKYEYGLDKAMKIEKGSDDQYYSIALMLPADQLKPGAHEYSFLVNKVLNNVMNFPEATDLEVKISPSSDNSSTKVDAITLKNKGRGIYSGELNLPSGEWNLNYSLSKGGKILVEGSKMVIKL